MVRIKLKSILFILTP